MKKWITLFWLVLFSLTVLAIMTTSNRPATSNAQARDCAIDLMLVVDSSNSIPPEDYGKVQEFATQLAESFVLGENDAQIGIIQFSSSVRLEIGLSTDIDAIKTAIANMEHLKENTNITGGLTLALEQFEGGREDIPHVIILVTDGIHNVGPGPIPVAESLRGEGGDNKTTILGVAVGEIKLDELIAIAGGDFNVIQVPNFDGLKQTLSILHDYSCAVSVPGITKPTSEPITPTPKTAATLEATGMASEEPTLAPTPTALPSPTPDPAEPEIAFVSDRDGDMEVFVMDETGGNVRQLTSNTVEDNAPSWSPDGRQIAYESGLDSKAEIWVINVDGTNPRQITSNGVGDWGPVWSPDGTQIAYHSLQGGNADIWVMNMDGTNPRQITNSSGIDRSASWSPDGQSIAYYSDKSGGREIYVVDLATGTERRLTTNDLYDGLPNWSPDGRLIVFASTRPQGDTEIWVMNADGTNPQRLTDHTGTDDDPAWLADGSRVVFEGGASGNYDVWVINADGTGLTQLTNSPGIDWLAAWRPNASGVAVVVPSVSAGTSMTPGFATPVPVDAGSVSSSVGDVGGGDPDNPVIPIRSTIEAAPGEVLLAPQGLTAGEIDDNKNFDVYLEYREGYAYYIDAPVNNVDITERHTIWVRTTDRYPVLGAEVKIMNGTTQVATLHTTATGLTYFFPLAYPSQTDTYQVIVSKDGFSASFNLTRATTDIRWDVTLDVPAAQAPVQLDVLFLVDTTSSMDEEIDALKINVRDIANQIDALPASPDVRYGLVLYRDYGDVYVTKNFDFTTSLDEFQRNLAQAQSLDGGDYPEAVNEAMYRTINEVSWRGGSTVQLVFLIGDAPPHLGEAYDYSVEMVNAASQGIKFFPVASGGLDFQGEYIFRQIAQFTGGRFIFLSSFSSTTTTDEGTSETIQNAYSVDELDTLVVDLVARELAVLFEQ